MNTAATIPAASPSIRTERCARARSTARVAELDAQVNADKVEGFTGIAHTRWATHGAPVVSNAHPHFSRERIGLVHNGIIENFEELRTELKGKGYEFASQTDTEVIAHLIDSLYDGDLFDAVKQATLRLKRRLRDRGVLPRRAAPRRRRPGRLAAGPRHRSR